MTSVLTLNKKKIFHVWFRLLHMIISCFYEFIIKPMYFVCSISSWFPMTETSYFQKNIIFKTHYCNAPTLIAWACCKQNDQHFTCQENIYLNFEGLLLDTCWHDVFKKQNKLSLHLSIRGLFVGEVSLGTLKWSAMNSCLYLLWLDLFCVCVLYCSHIKRFPCVPPCRKTRFNSMWGQRLTHSFQISASISLELLRW